MTKKKELYKCNVCGNIVEILHEGEGKLVCCDEEMQLLSENTVDAAKEKHVPIIKRTEGEVIVKVGSVSHPMQEDHYIEWVELTVGDRTLRKELKSGDVPEAKFCICESAPISGARAYCNLHGLWKGE